MKADMNYLDSWAGLALGGASPPPADLAARLGRLLRVTADGAWTPPPRRPATPREDGEADWRSERLPPSGESGGVPECADIESLPDRPPPPPPKPWLESIECIDDALSSRPTLFKYNERNKIKSKKDQKRRKSKERSKQRRRIERKIEGSKERK